MAVEIEYACADGTPFPVSFADEEMAARRWRLDREHGAFPSTPLMRALSTLGRPGTQAVYEKYDLPQPNAFDAGPQANGFSYIPDTADPTEGMDMERMVAGIGKLIVDHGGALGVWRDATMPHAQAAVAFLEAAGADTTLEEAAYQHAYGMAMTMVSAFVCFNDHQLLMAACAEVRPEDAELLAYELTQGYENPTLRADQELWELGRLILASMALSDALGSDDPAGAMRAVRAAGSEDAFFARLDSFLAEYGGRAESWDIVCPTWREQAAGFWQQLRQLAVPDAPSPADALAEAARRREALADEIAAQIGDPDKVARFRRRYERAACYVLVREERAQWQLMLSGATRQVALRHGARLVEEGRLADAADVFYLEPEELTGDGDLRGLAAERRAVRDRWLEVTPPAVIGGEAAKQATAPTLPADGVLKGVPASRGKVTGPARIVTDLADADRVEPGDVLVCILTAPPWTPLFGIASAVVADTGGLSSHPAIAAREYGIPCVLNTRIGTAVIPDGAMVTVDGEQGIVQVAN